MDMPFDRRMLYVPIFHIDTNLINAKQKLAEVNRLEKWADEGVILINMSGVAHAEAQADGNPQRVKKAATHIYTIQGADEDQLFAKVEACLFEGGAKDDNQRNDVRIICEAIKYQATLVTNDGASKSQPGGILGNREKLKALTDIKIMSPAEAVSLVEEKIAARDDQFDLANARRQGQLLREKNIEGHVVFEMELTKQLIAVVAAAYESGCRAACTGTEIHGDVFAREWLASEQAKVIFDKNGDVDGLTSGIGHASRVALTVNLAERLGQIDSDFDAVTP